MAKLSIIENPLAKRLLGKLRDQETNFEEFRASARALGAILSYEACAHVPMTSEQIQTPLAEIEFENFAKKIVLAPVLRAGLALSDGASQILPNADFALIGLYRDEQTLQPKKYFFKSPPELDKKKVLLLDMIVATGGSTAAAAQMLQDAGANDITLVCVVASKVGIETFQKLCPSVEAVCCAIDPKLNENGYVVPGIGDAGDRFFGTK